MYFSPPDHPKCPGFGLGVYGIFFPKCPFFGVASLGNETPGLVSETRERPGISRVKCCMGSRNELYYVRIWEFVASENRGTFQFWSTLSLSFSALLSALSFSAFFLLAPFSLLAPLCAKRLVSRSRRSNNVFFVSGKCFGEKMAMVRGENRNFPRKIAIFRKKS